MDGMLMEIGPFRTTASGNLTYRAQEYLHDAAFVFLDQPVGTGLGYVGDTVGLAKSFAEVE